MKLDIELTIHKRTNSLQTDLMGFKNFTPISRETVNICKGLESSGNGLISSLKQKKTKATKKFKSSF